MALLATIVVVLLARPVKDSVQNALDRVFYRDRYDYRRTLIEFARELGSPADMGEMLESVADRLIRTLGISHVAFFVWNEAEQKFQLEMASNRQGRTENALQRLPFRAVYLFRPAAIVPLHGIRSKTGSYRILYALARPILPILKPLFPNAVTTTEQVGRAMLTVARNGYPTPVLETRDINSL